MNCATLSWQSRGGLKTLMQSTSSSPPPPPSLSPRGTDDEIPLKSDSPMIEPPLQKDSSLKKIQATRMLARRRGPFFLEDITPRSEFEEFEVIGSLDKTRYQAISKKIDPFRIVLAVHPSTSSSSADHGALAKMVEMKCFICGVTLQLPSYAALQKKCHLKCSSCDTGETHAKNWMDIILTALYNLEILHQRQYFHCKSEICAFIDHHWSSICPERARTPTWGNTVMSQISTHPELFQSHQRGSGYGALKRASSLDKEVAKNTEEEGEKDVLGGEKRAENKNKRRSELKVLGKEDDENQEYFIEEVLSKRLQRGVVEYFVKWEGLADAENSWEKVHDLECPELMQDFESEARRHPQWKEGAGQCSKRKRGNLAEDQKCENKTRRPSKRRLRIPVSQWCHHCLRIKPVIVCCDGIATGKCSMQYCERCLEKHYDEEIIVLQKAKGEWLCPRCRGICCCAACDPESKRVKPISKKQVKEPVISRIIARCKIEGTNEWEYLVHYRGRAESENRWVRSSQINLPPNLKKRYRNTLKMRITKKNRGAPLSEMVRPSKAGTPGGSRTVRTPKGLRTSDFDISRVVFDDQVHRVIVPEKPEVITPSWRFVQDEAPTNRGPTRYSEKRESNGNSIPTVKIAGVVEIDASVDVQSDEGSSSEDTSDEAFARRHAHY